MVSEAQRQIIQTILSEPINNYLNNAPDQDKFNFTLGGDFEGMILTPDGHNSIDAKDTIFNSTSHTAWVGRDGSGAQIEFRFKPSHYPHKVIKNFEESLTTFRNWAIQGNSAGVCFGYYKFSRPLGGHIHFGKKPCIDLLEKLDYYISVPLLLISNVNEFKLRCSTGYGKLSEMENKSYGFEDRTPGNFMINKELATEIYVTAGLIADQYKHLASARIDEEFKEKYYSGDKTYFIQNHLESIKEEIVKVAFTRFENWGWALCQTLKFLNRLESMEEIISSNKEILKSWNLLPDNLIKKSLIKINSDDFLTDFEYHFVNSANKQINLDRDLLIYGVKASRSSEDFEIWLNEPLFKKLTKSLDGKKLETYHIKSGKFGIASDYNYTIGLSYELRKLLYEHPDDKDSINWIRIIKEVISLCVG